MLLTYMTAMKPVPEWLTLQWCADFIEDWFKAYPEVRKYLRLEHKRADKMGIVYTDYGRFRRISEVYSVDERIRMAGHRYAGNMPIQGDCADIMRIAIHNLYMYFERFQKEKLRLPEKQWSYMLLSVHDQMITEVPEDANVSV
jgi:DNA polymerase-1